MDIITQYFNNSAKHTDYELIYKCVEYKLNTYNHIIFHIVHNILH